MPPTSQDIEAAFLMSLPLIRLPKELSGSCRVAVRRVHRATSNLTGALVEVRNGVLRSCTTRLEGTPSSWAVGSTTAWFAAVTSGDPQLLELGGDPRLAAEVVEHMHGALFGAAVRL